MNHLEERGELLRIDRPVDVVYEAGAIADLLVKNNTLIHRNQDV